LLALMLSAVACGSTEPSPLLPTAEVPATAAPPPTEAPPTAPEVTAPPPIPTQVTAIHDFLYQLQNLDLEAIGQTGYDLIVMDYSAAGDDETAFTADQIATLKNSPGGPKILLAYMSIGEAEDYRFYWNPDWDADDDGQPDTGAPAWLDVVNPDWEGNYKIRYWDPGWQAIIYGNPGSYLDKIIAAGFDGVYLDIIDAYGYYEEQGRHSAAREMVDFVIQLAGYARARRPGFLIFPQNAAELAADFPDYLATVDGIGQEEVYYGYPDDGDLSSPDFLSEVEPNLDLFVKAGKTVLATAYTTDPTQIDDQYARARARGYVPFATVRDLDQLTINAGHEPETSQPAFTFAYETRPDGSFRLTDPPPGASDQNPAFSPDGTRLLFTRFENGYNEGPSAIYLLDLTSGAVSLLTAAPDSDNVNLPGTSWNAATERITFASDRDDTDEVWTMAADGSDLFRVTRNTPVLSQVEGTASYFIEPSFSPDGQWIIFEADPDVPEDQQQGSIWKVRADGTGLTQLTDGPSGDTDDRQPNWSPSGDRILFQRRAPGPSTGPSTTLRTGSGQSSDDWNLYTMAPDGSDVRQVTIVPSSDTDASWSPDGRWIVYSSDYGSLPVPNIFVIPVNGGEPIRATHNETRYDGAPSWSPDGQWIAFESHPGDEDIPAALWLITAPVTEQAATALPADSDRLPSEARLAGVTHWFYMINVNLEPEMVNQIAASDYDMVVLDFIPSEANNTDYPMADVIAQLHNAPHHFDCAQCKPKLVIAYIDTGQAEEYRTYWQASWGIGNPQWIVGADPDGWEGNFPVAYWYDEWREIWLGEDSYLQAILDAGFDGVYLDWVEAYSDENVTAIAQREGADPKQEMIWWVGDIADFGRAQRPDFIVIAQNAAELAKDDDYLAVIDAIAQEQVWFDGGADNDPPGDCPLPRTEAEVDSDAYRQSLSAPCHKLYDDYPDSTLHVSSDEYLRYLTLARDKGKIIFTVDYALEPENVAWVYEASRALGFVPFANNRGLDRYVEPVP